MRKAVFLDRDGVLVPDIGYPHRPQHAVLFPDVIGGLRALQAMGFQLVVVTNQSGVGRGLYSLDDVEGFHDRLREELERVGVVIQRNEFYVCPHSPDDSCDCRKPAPGLILRAALEHQITLRHSIMVGDKETDIEAGLTSGTWTVLLDRDGQAGPTRADYVASGLDEVVEIAIRIQGQVR